MKLRRKLTVGTAVVFLAGILSACAGNTETGASPQNQRTGIENQNSTVEVEQAVHDYRKQMDLLEKVIVTDSFAYELGDEPAGEVGHAVFLSVCDPSERAGVVTGTGSTLNEAWNDAETEAVAYVEKHDLDVRWVKADVTCFSEKISAEELAYAVKAERHEFFRYGLALDDAFETAFIEAELNGAKIYEYENGGLDQNYMNSYLKKSGREQVAELPDEYRILQCFGWFCDENYQIYQLSDDYLDYGRRKIDVLDDAYTEMLIGTSMDFLVSQLKEDGSFIYGMYPRFDNEIENYNIVRHAAAIWSMVCRYRMTGDENLAAKTEKAIEFLLENVKYSDEDTAYLYEEKDDEIKLGGSGLALIAMTEYMDARGNENYKDVCIKLGNGILTMLDQESGQYYHVLNGDYSKKEAFRTVYYDGEATFGLCQLYELTGDVKWLEAATLAVEHFIAGDYWQYKDHWVAYSMNAITKHVNDPRYYDFALECAQRNLEEIRERDTTYHTYLELLMATFELYDRMITEEISTEYLAQFDEDAFLDTIYTRANRMLNGYFYPEYAMYMENPQKVLGTFMVRHDGYRIRIDDVQHNIGGYFKYYENYDKLVEYGMLEQ